MPSGYATLRLEGRSAIIHIKKRVLAARARQSKQELEQRPAASLGLDVANEHRPKKAKMTASEALQGNPVIQIAVPVQPGSCEERQMKMVNDLKKIQIEATQENFAWVLQW